MKPELHISVARMFSRTPGPRYEWQGPWSGEQFRRQHLESALKEAERLVIDLDGTRGYGSSFLDEAFGGLVREGVMTAKDLWKRLSFISAEDSSYPKEIETSIFGAKRKH